MSGALHRTTLTRLLEDDGDEIDRLSEALRSGAVAAIPTESTYGLAVDPRCAAGVDAVYEIKGRSDSLPLPVVVADASQAAALGVDTGHPLWRAATRLWPGALTVVLETARALPAQRGADSLALRIPGHRPLRQLLGRIGFGLTATSANRSGEPSLVDPDAVAELLAPHGGWLLDGGELPGGPPSTVVAWNASQGAAVVLRHGAVRFP
ncbi:MAG: Sua5/YciO/YrdC/YwlC family protein [Acidobacteria bacterium]|nr:MAG: Sua5/YciO/YrdC/YwlC family protein [Acidobacteriota bacterium]REK07841.1 MAG: Sua5/YciO/YrdC/YwlC family protein [Acidobacteriota bacterium]